MERKYRRGREEKGSKKTKEGRKWESKYRRGREEKGRKNTKGGREIAF